MAILKSLNCVAMPAHSNASPEQHRRTKLVGALNEQKAMAAADKEGREISVTRRRWAKVDGGEKKLVDVPKRLKRWWHNGADGKWLFAIRYGNKVIEIEKGKAAIVVGASDKLIPTIETIISAVQAGELDSHLAQMGFTKSVKKRTK